MILLPQKKQIRAFRRISYEALGFAFFSYTAPEFASYSYTAPEFGLPSRARALCRSEFFEIPTERPFFQNSLLRSARFSKTHF